MQTLQQGAAEALRQASAALDTLEQERQQWQEQCEQWKQASAARGFAAQELEKRLKDAEHEREVLRRELLLRDGTYTKTFVAGGGVDVLSVPKVGGVC